MNCCVEPRGTASVWGLMAIDTICAAVTVRTADPVTAPELALRIAVPGPWLVVRPVFEIVATDGVSDVQVAVEVRF